MTVKRRRVMHYWSCEVGRPPLEERLYADIATMWSLGKRCPLMIKIELDAQSKISVLRSSGAVDPASKTVWKDKYRLSFTRGKASGPTIFKFST